MSESGSALTVTKLRDGSVCEVEDDDRMALVSRLVDGERVWGQVFSGGWWPTWRRPRSGTRDATCGTRRAGR